MCVFFPNFATPINSNYHVKPKLLIVMNRLIFCLLLWATALICLADVTISGHVRSLGTRDAIVDAEIRIPGSNASVITNEDGYFTFKVSQQPRQLIVSALGHRNMTVSRQKLADNPDDLEIWLVPETRILDAVTVYTAEDLVRQAIARIPQNYCPHTERLSCFYRETTRKQSRYVNLSEAVMSLYKTDYSHGVNRDLVYIIKGRSLISQRAQDTLSVKVAGGPYESVILDVVKNREIFLYEDDLPCYHFSMQESTSIDERPQYVISFEPVLSRTYALYHGTLYIDMERLAFTRMELRLDMSDRQKATQMMLLRKPFGLRFRPRELTSTICYHFDGEYFRLSYMRNFFHFNCDWKKRWISSTYRVVSEMVVTDYEADQMPRSRRDAFGRHDVLDPKAENFNDPEFWESYNILEPSESLEHAVQKLKKRARGN